jgi:hypothetical protein
MDDPDRLEYKTWLQLKECTYVALTALRKAASPREGPAAYPADAREALERIEYILSPDWKGPDRSASYEEWLAEGQEEPADGGSESERES